MARQWAVPLLHPAAVLRGRHALGFAQAQHLKRAVALAEGTWTPPAPEDHPGPTLPAPTHEECLTWEREVQAHEDRTLTVDIECAGPHLVAVGLCHVPTLSALCLRFRAQGGAPWRPTEEETYRDVCWLDGVLASPGYPKWFHNGQSFDIPYLEGLGFRVEGFAGDTLLLQRYLYPDMPADLQFVANFYADIPPWKWLVSQDDEKGK